MQVAVPARRVPVAGRGARIPTTRTVDAATDQGSVPGASRIIEGFLRAHQAATPPSLSAGPCQRVLDGYTLANNLDFQFGAVTVGLGKMLLSATGRERVLFCGTSPIFAIISMCIHDRAQHDPAFVRPIIAGSSVHRGQLVPHQHIADTPVMVINEKIL